MKKIKTGSWWLALVAGIVGSLVMFILMELAIGKGMAPFNVPPSAAMVIKAGFDPKPLALVLHLAYGAAGSLIMVAIYKTASSIKTGLLVAFILWLIFMLIYSPIIGWGVFGFGDASSLPKDAPLHLVPGPKFLIATLILHFIYGAVIGLLDNWFVKAKEGHIS